MILPWLLFPLVGALIGWCTNWIAVRMLFRPRRPRSLLGFRLQGLVPRRQEDLAASIARTVERELISVEEIQGMVAKLAESDEVRAILHQRVDALIGDQMRTFGPIVRSFIADDVVVKIERRIEDEVVLFIEGLSGELHRGLGERLDIQTTVRRKIESFDLVRLEEIIRRIAARELRHIEWLGGVLGFLVGLVEAGILAALR